MKYAILDTETNGLPRYDLPADDPSQPRLAELAVIILDEDLTELSAFSIYVQPDGWQMEPGATAVNGLTDELLQAQGHPVRDVLDQYTDVIRQGVVVCAYNARHDLKIMRGELRRAGMPDLFYETPNTCLMRSAMKLGVAKASGKGGFPKLDDVCAHLGIAAPAKHTAMGDARSALAVFRHLHAAGLLIAPAVHEAKIAPDHAAPPTKGDALVKEAKAARKPRKGELPLAGDAKMPEAF